MMSVECHVGRHRGDHRQQCGPNHNLQTLGEIDAPTPNKQVKKLSWMILSRIGINYLVNPASFTSWTVCLNHRRELLDNWQVGKECCYPDHKTTCATSPLQEMVSMVMSIKIIQTEGKVVPISGKICQDCKNIYDSKYGFANTSNKVVIVIPRGNQAYSMSQTSSSNRDRQRKTKIHTALNLPSPFIKQEPLGLEEDTGEKEAARSSSPAGSEVSAMAMKTETVGPTPTEEEITIKQEEIDIPSEKEKTPSPPPTPATPLRLGRRVPIRVLPSPIRNSNDESSSEEDSLFSEDSDDDRTWAPMPKKKKAERQANKETRPRRVLPQKRPRGRPRKVTPVKEFESAASSTESDDDSAQVTPLVDGGGSNLHYYCNICQITFYKHESYKLHMRSNRKNHREIQARKEKGHECTECSMAFVDEEAQSRHMLEVHKKQDDGKRKRRLRGQDESQDRSFYCMKCNVALKNESAFKSHNSKLHLERREKIYYCRECDETFKCREKQQEHIKTHRLWSGKEAGMQCQICGKVFSKTQMQPYQRHLAIHESEGNEECHCSSCEHRSKKRKLAPSDSAILSNEQPEEADPLEENVDDPVSLNPLKDVAPEENVIELDEEDDELPFHCALCPQKFAIPTDLEDHVKAAHQGNVFAGPQKPDEKPRFTRVRVSTKSQIQEVKNNCWQDSVERNWAADFGYGKPTTNKNMPIGDLFNKMKLKFRTLGDNTQEKGDASEEEEEDDTLDADRAPKEEFEIFRVRGFKGTEKSSLQKAPRTLSAASLNTRKRIDKLILRAKEHQQEREKKRIQRSQQKRREDKKQKEVNLKKKTEKLPVPAKPPSEVAADDSSTQRISEQPMAHSNAFEKEQPPQIQQQEPTPQQPVAEHKTAVDTAPSTEQGIHAEASTTDKEPSAPEPEAEESGSAVATHTAVGEVFDEDEDLSYDDDDDDADSDDYSDDEEDEFPLEPASPEQEKEAEDIVLEVLSQDVESIMIPLNNGWVCEKVPKRKEKGAFRNFFWSTEDEAVDPFKSVGGVFAYCKRKGLSFNRAVFEKAIQFVPIISKT